MLKAAISRVWGRRGRRGRRRRKQEEEERG
jgi:hypothetical protein